VLILALDTCLAACQAALWRDGEAVAVASEPMSRGHQERLAPMVAALMAEAGVELSSVDRFAVTAGPGSFTGLRVGLAFAKGLALALAKPLVGISALEALAQGRAGGPNLVLIDARRDQAYWQAFDGESPLTPPQAWALTDIVDWALEHGSPRRLIGPGAALLGTRFPAAELDARVAADPMAIAALAASREPGGVRPLYLRTPDAKLPGGIDPFA
jgi:tRNA threonylcarbamoyladenosine biosynthesis protein TsaB